MNGSSIMEGYTPEIDATIVTRMLDAGAVIAGKAHCENFCLSGGSHTNAKGPIHNPYKRGYMAGGSSAGSAALVAAGEVERGVARLGVNVGSERRVLLDGLDDALWLDGGASSELGEQGHVYISATRVSTYTKT